MKKTLLLALLAWLHLSLPARDKTIGLSGDRLRIEWTQSKQGWAISKIQVNGEHGWQTLPHPSGEYTLLYSSQKPSDSAAAVFKTITGNTWPDPAYKYQINLWKQNTAAVALNTAGEATQFFPANAEVINNKHIVFTQETPLATIRAHWQLDSAFATDIHVAMSVTGKQAGYYSIATPSISTIQENELSWATVPGYFQGNEMQKNFILAYAYGQGIPQLPVIYRERCASSFCPVITTKQELSIAAIPDPGQGRDPWAKDKNTHQDWLLAVSHMNRKAALTPTLYYPVLGQPSSLLQPGDQRNFTFRYSIMHAPWYKMLDHAVNDIYQFRQALTLRRNQQSLVDRIEKMQGYLSDKQTSLWNIEDYKGLKIGGQSYLGGVVGSNRDAIKNSDYGAMWMLANASNDPYLKDSVLPYALNFKLAQQQTDTGFFRGAAIGQYYLANSKHFTEEWGEFVEPVSLTYYIMLDIGNILLFEPDNSTLRERLTMGAQLLMQWQKADGSWEVAYDKYSRQPLFTDIRDLRPTFYGLMVAYRILKDPRYLEAAKKGADWFIAEAVNKGHFIGVCGDARYAPDFATGQSAQALLDLYDLTRDQKYRDAAIASARMYLGAVYTQPVPSKEIKTVNGIQREDWQISQSGLSFEHGGIIGSANGAGPIMLCSHAGLFVRMYQLTKENLFIEMARAAAIGRDAFVDPKTSVASYYWNAMNKGAGPYPHHAWWQIGWITDYLMAEAQLRSGNKIVFPRGFVTPKVGPHQSYGFAPGKIYGQDAALLIRKGLISNSNPNIEYLLAHSPDYKKLFVIALNDTGDPQQSNLELHTEKFTENKTFRSTHITELTRGQNAGSLTVQLEGYGMRVYEIGE